MRNAVICRVIHRSNPVMIGMAAVALTGGPVPDPVFPGVDALLTLVRSLVRRPRLFERDHDLQVRGDLPLPLVCLIREPGADGFLPRLDRALEGKLQKAPHVLVDVARTEHSGAVLPLLHWLHVELRGRQLGRNQLKRFDHYELAHHLTCVDLPPRQSKREEPVEAVLRAWSSKSPLPGSLAEVADKAGERTQFAMALAKFAGRLVGLYWGRDRVPGLGRERRWFMGQPYMVPRHSLDFFGFAARLTGERRDSESPDQVRKLLVHAFLEDLRVAYRRTRWGFLPRRRGLRRTTHVTVLLDELSPLYFQLVPDNSKQAELLGDYARRNEATAVTIYHSPVDGTNTYVTSLVEAMSDKFGESGVPVSTSGWSDSPTELPTLCADQTNRSREMVFYAGRENDFGDFLRTIRRNCADLTRLPRIVADDATSRFVAHAPGRGQNDFNGLAISYVGMGGLVVLAGKSCVEGKSGALAGGAPALDAFCAGYRKLREELASLPAEERPVMPWPGERVGGLYDTAGLFVDAVRQLRSSGSAPPHPAAVAQQFREMSFLGTTGVIDFRGSRIANGRNLAVLTIKNVSDVEGDDGVPKCALMIGTLYGETQPREDNGCPKPP